MNNNNIRKLCYSKGISLFEIKNDEIVPKNVSILYRQCSANINSNNKIINDNSLVYKVPPKEERMRAMLQHNKTLTLNNVKLMVADPFYSFKNPRYNSVNVKRGDPNTYPLNHEVYKILPEYFPQPYSTRRVNVHLKKKEKTLNNIIAQARIDLARVKARKAQGAKKKQTQRAQWKYKTKHPQQAKKHPQQVKKTYKGTTTRYQYA